MYLRSISKIWGLPRINSGVLFQIPSPSSTDEGNEKFKLCVDVSGFTKDEISIKASADYVTIEGKQEKRKSNKLIKRQILRRFKLPEDCNVDAMESHLLSDGSLIIKAPRKAASPCETTVPVVLEQSPLSPELKNKDLCSYYMPKNNKTVK